jgi:hypothetical protein
MVKAATAGTGMSKAAEAAQGIVEEKEVLRWRESLGSSQESWQQRRSLRWSRSECCVGPAGASR